MSFIDIPLKNKSIGKYSPGSHLYFSAESTDMWSYRLSIRDTQPDRELDGRQPKEVFSSLQQDVESLCVWVTNLLAALAAARIWYSLERWRKVLNFFMGKDKSPDEKCLRGWCWKDSRFIPCSLEKNNLSFTARPICTWCLCQSTSQPIRVKWSRLFFITTSLHHHEDVPLYYFATH